MPLGANKVALLGVAGAVTDTAILLSTAVASGDSSVTFSVPATYKQICFKLYAISVSTDGTHIRFQGSINGGSSHGVTATSTYFRTYHNENNVSADGPGAAWGMAQSTNPQLFLYGVTNSTLLIAIIIIIIDDFKHISFFKIFSFDFLN